MTNLFADVRFGFRMLRKDAPASILAAVSMALGIAAVTCIFSVVHAVLFDSFPYKDVDRIVSTGIEPSRADSGAECTRSLSTPPCGSGASCWKMPSPWALRD
jgi:hypothetical protein